MSTTMPDRPMFTFTVKMPPTLCCGALTSVYVWFVDNAFGVVECPRCGAAWEHAPGEPTHVAASGRGEG